ncbi:MAG: PA14 domain-containing protein [Dehalococcoidia bacterium]|nr:PA14 domain-containing protein [Dehalococcoidia bacterium]
MAVFAGLPSNGRGVVSSLGVPTPCTDGQYLARYWGNDSFAGDPLLSRCEDAPIRYDWGVGGPGEPIFGPPFSGRWMGEFYSAAGDYVFSGTADDGIRIFVDGGLVVDGWRAQGATEYDGQVTLGQGQHSVIVEYNNVGGAGVLFVNWDTLAVPSTPQCPPEVGAGHCYDMNVLIIRFFPLTPDGQNLDINVTGDIDLPLSSIRLRTIQITKRLIQALEESSTYLGYRNSNAQPSLRYRIVDTQERLEAVPHTDGAGPNPDLGSQVIDYQTIMQQNAICHYVDDLNVQEVWIWAYPWANGFESKMSGPFGDISNSYRSNDMPLCGHTYRVYTFNYGSGTANALESWGHQMEAELDAINGAFFRDIFQGPNYPQALGVTGRCGSVHNAPNARFEYDRFNPTGHLSDCLDWNPDALGSLSLISCANWGCEYNGDDHNAARNYQVWNWQNLPGFGNGKMYQGRPLRNFWDIHADFDGVMGFDRTIFLLDEATPTPTPTPTPAPTSTPTGGTGAVLWGDIDCLSGITIGDAQKIARVLIDIAITQGPGCPQIGGNVTAGGQQRLWGDIDCGGAVTIGDAQKIARDLIDLAVSQAAGCPRIGETA